MQHYTPYIKDFMERFRYPAEAVSMLTQVEQRLDNEPEFGARFNRHITAYMLEDSESLGDALKGMTDKDFNAIMEDAIKIQPVSAD